MNAVDIELKVNGNNYRLTVKPWRTLVEVLREEVASLRQEVAELAERQDFAERLLAQAREKGLLQAPRDR